MKTKTGGTLVWCSNCAEYRISKALNPSRHGRAGQRFEHEGEGDIKWFCRSRKCLTCEHEWLAAEIDEGLLKELVDLRHALKTIKIHAARYSAEAMKAQLSLKALSDSLSVLKALDAPNEDLEGDLREDVSHLLSLLEKIR